MTSAPASSSRTAGSQTLARGLRALKAVVTARDGMSVHEIADYLGVHRTIAYRIMNTICDAGLLRRSDDGRYRGATGLLELASGAHMALRAAALPVMHDVADKLQCAVSLLVREGSEAVALAVVEPRGQTFRIVFAQGSRTPLDRGAAAYALRSLDPPAPDDLEQVVSARERGYAVSHGEVEPGMYGFAVPVPGLGHNASAVVNLITNRFEIVDNAREIVMRAAEAIADNLNRSQATVGAGDTA